MKCAIAAYVHFRAWAGGVGASLFAFACVADRAAEDAANHTAGELFWDNAPYSWADVDRETIDSVTGTLSVPADHIVTQRLQAWIDRYDRELRALVRSKTGEAFVAPKPAARVIANARANAFVSFYATCLASSSGGTSEPASDAAGSAPARLVVLDSPKRAVLDFGGSCVAPRSWPADPALRLAWFDGQGGAQIASVGGSLEISAAEERVNFPPEATGTLRARQVAVVAALPYVTVHAPLVGDLSEKAVAAAVAHELGHYYRAHLSTANVDKYGFWYHRDQPLAVRPVPAADQEIYRQKYEQVRAGRFVVSNQKYDSRFAPTLLAWATQMNTPPGHVCAPMEEAVRGWSDAVRADLDPDGLGDLTSDDKRAYLALEAAAKACFDTLRLTDGASSEAWTADAAPRAWFLQRMALPLKVDRDWSPPKAQSLGELVRLLEVRAEELRGRGAEFAAELERNRIGMYTTEQEADDIAMELAARVGLRPDDVLDGYLEMMHALEHADPAEFARYDNGLSADQCAALYRAGFRAPAADGGLDDVYVPLGVLYDPHHAWCYRVFNLFREKQVHGYTTGPADFPPDDPPWAQVRAAAAAVGTSTSSPDAGGRARDAAVTDAAPTDAGSSSAGQVSDDPPSATPGAEGASSRGCSSAPRASGSLAALVPMLFAAVVRLVRDRGRRAARSRI